MCSRLLWFAALTAISVSPPPAQADGGGCGPWGREPDSLADGFRDPPLSARPAAYWCWLDGSTDLAQLTRELEEVKEKGLSELYIFDVGAQDPENEVPDGPPFMGPESIRAIGHAVREAGRLGLEIGLITSSSWNAGGAWVKPEHASMGLYHCEKRVRGPLQFSGVLPFPPLPKKTPRKTDGSPVFSRDVAVLAIPEPKRVSGYEFLIELAPPRRHTVDHVILYNTRSDDPERHGEQHLFAKDFVVSASATTADEGSFKEIVRGALRPTVEAQRFDFEPLTAKYVKLTVLSGHNRKAKSIQLGEFEVYSTDGINVAARYSTTSTDRGAELLYYTSELGTRGQWTAGNIHDGAKSGPGGSWSSGGPPPRRMEDLTRVVDLTERLEKGGRLDWEVPPGEWVILRFVCANTGQGLYVPSPKSNGLAIDHFSSQATRAHFQYFVDRLKAELGSLERSALRRLYLCSYEVRGRIWTPEFGEEFRRRRGYDMTPYLPAVVGWQVGNQEVTRRFQHDFRKTLGEVLVDAFYRTAREISNANGLQLCAEAGGPGPPLHQVPVDALQALGVLDIPRGEFWKEHDVWVVKETACASHIYGKRIVDMEAFTSWRHWQDGPFDLKPIADRALCGGTNHFTFHTSAHNPAGAGKPGWVYHAGTHMGPKLAWWPLAKPFIDYLARCSYLLQQGLFVGDVCYYYGDQGFNFVPPKHVDPSLGSGFDYDVTNAEVILERMEVRNGRIALPDGLSYELLVLPDREDVNWNVLRKLEDLVRSGATVVGRKPTRSGGLTDYPRRDKLVRELADKLWGPCDGDKVKEHAHGKGKIIWGRRLREILGERGIGPDFTFSSPRDDAELDFIHRRTGEADIYFVVNKKMRPEHVECVFRVSGKAPELWLPDSGEVRRLVVHDRVGRGMRVPLSLSPGGSVFVVFREAPTEPRVVAVRRNGRRVFPRVPGVPETLPSVEAWSDGGGAAHLLAFQGGAYILETASGSKVGIDVDSVPPTQEITGPWEVRFPPDWGAPTSKTFHRLISWTEDADDGVRHFSGVATYQKEIEVPTELLGRDVEVFLDLGRVRVVADLRLNDEPLGVVWKPPFRRKVTGALRPGKNRLVVKVANTWSNRLVGDANSPPDRRYCRTNMKKALTWRSPWKTHPLLESGLIGPVRLVAARKVVLNLSE